MSLQTKKIIYISLLTILIFIILPLVLSQGKYNVYMLSVIPFGIGLFYALLFSLFRKQSIGKLMGYSFIVLLIVSISTILIAGEGAICYLIMGLYLLMPYYLGIIIGHFIQKKIWIKNSLLILVFGTIFTSATLENTFNNSIVVKDEITINMSSKAMWQKITSPVNFGNSTNFFFTNGVSYPNNMQIETINNVKFLKCKYNNGSIMAPIIDYKENKSFTFSFSDSIATMKEKNLYNESKTMHLKNHFLIDYGKFEIIEIDNNKCKLVTSTSFKHKFEPEFYTNFWVEYFVHNVHKHVLENIKNN